MLTTSDGIVAQAPPPMTPVDDQVFERMADRLQEMVAEMRQAIKGTARREHHVFA